MYEIFFYSGGIYRFNELKEAVEDIGGLILKKNVFHISRGSSFLAQEVEIMLIMPEEEENAIRSFARELKGDLEKLDVEALKKNEVFTYIVICDVLTRSGKWMNRDELEEEIVCPCPAQLCNQHDLDACIHDQLDESLDRFCMENMLQSRKKGVIEYYIIENE